MGMGDKKPKFHPTYTPVRDDVIGKMFFSTRECPHPAVIKKYGTGGIANVSYWTCKMCQYGEDMKMFGGVKCGYKQQET